MIDLVQTLRQFAKLFERLGLPYAVIGGFAVRVYGIPRPTHDIGFTLAIARERLADLYEAVRGLGYSVPDQYSRGGVDQVAGIPLVRFSHAEGHGIDVDFFLAESAFQQSLLSRRRRERIEDTPIWLVTPEDLILRKLPAGPPRDIADIDDILFTQVSLDEQYLRSWAGEFGVRGELESALAEQTF